MEIPFNTLIDNSNPEQRRVYWIVLAAVVAILLAMIWIPQYNTLVDYPAHLARVCILHNYDHTPFFQSLFTVAFEPVPNLAIDLMVPPLLYLLPPVAAGKVFLSLIVLLFAAGCHWIAMAVYGRPSWSVPIAAFAVFNSSFLAGFVNSVFSLSLCFFTLAMWLTARRKWTPLRWLGITLLSTLVYISHLAGFLFLGLAIGASILFDIYRQRRIRLVDFVAGSVLVPAVGIYFYPWAHKIPMQGPVIEWGSLAKKALGLASVFLGYHYRIDVVAVLLLAAAVGVGAVKGKVHFEPLLLWLAILFFAAAFLMPNGRVDAANRFVPPAMVFLFLACSATFPRKIACLVLSLAFAGMLLRTGEIAWQLNRTSSDTALMLAALDKTAPNSRIYSLVFRPQNIELDKRSRSYVHLTSYSTIQTRSVASDFSTFASPGERVLIFRDPAEWEADESPTSLNAAYLDARLVNFDYVYACNVDPAHRGYLEQHATLVASGGEGSLWKVRNGNPPHPLAARADPSSR